MLTRQVGFFCTCLFLKSPFHAILDLILEAFPKKTKQNKQETKTKALGYL
jgi:hypothetical protein